MTKIHALTPCLIATLLLTGTAARAAECPAQAIGEIYKQFYDADSQHDIKTARSYASRMWQLSDSSPQDNCKVREFMQTRVAKLYPNPSQPRRESAGFAMEALDASAASKPAPALPTPEQAARQLGVAAQ